MKVFEAKNTSFSQVKAQILQIILWIKPALLIYGLI